MFPSVLIGQISVTYSLSCKNFYLHYCYKKEKSGERGVTLRLLIVFHLVRTGTYFYFFLFFLCVLASLYPETNPCIGLCYNNQTGKVYCAMVERVSEAQAIQSPIRGVISPLC